MPRKSLPTFPSRNSVQYHVRDGGFRFIHPACPSTLRSHPPHLLSIHRAIHQCLTSPTLTHARHGRISPRLILTLLSRSCDLRRQPVAPRPHPLGCAVCQCARRGRGSNIQYVPETPVVGLFSTSPYSTRHSKRTFGFSSYRHLLPEPALQFSLAPPLTAQYSGGMP